MSLRAKASFVLALMGLALTYGAAWGQAGIPNGCAVGIPNTLVRILSLGIPNGCGFGIPQSGGGGSAPSGCSGALDLSTGCAQLVAIGVLF
jgi:hypothetical protein